MQGKLLASPLTSIFGGQCARALELLLNVEALLSVRDVARQIDISPSTASTALESLNAQGVIIRQVVGVAHLYKVNTHFFLMPYLKKLVDASQDLDRKTVDYLRAKLSSVEAVILYGSHARRASNPTSDIDLLVIHSSARAQQQAEQIRHEIRRHLTTVIGREISVISVTAPTKKTAATPFWLNISREGICLYGKLPAHILSPKTRPRGGSGTSSSKKTRAK